MKTKLTILSALLVGAMHGQASGTSGKLLYSRDNTTTALRHFTPQEAAQQAGLIFITKQEAADVVKSLDDGLNGLIVAGEFYAVAERMDQPTKDRDAVVNNLKEVVKRAVAARTVLETWRKKVEGAK